MALQRGEAHIAPIHLLDESSGEYNRSFVKKTLPALKAVLVKGVRRVQGLIVPKGNPKGVASLEDLERLDLKFVNRQRGSGTRLLLDYRLKVLGIDPSGIIGYGREMTTHMAVASAVQSGTADVGLGIQSAAEILGLDFIHVGVEDYDFLVPEQYVECLPVQRFIETLKSDSFKERVTALGGYELENPGMIIEL